MKSIIIKVCFIYNMIVKNKYNIQFIIVTYVHFTLNIFFFVIIFKMHIIGTIHNIYYSVK